MSTQELYNTNKDFHDYVDNFVKSNPDCPLDMALRTRLVAEVAMEYEHGVNSNGRKHEVKTVW